MFMLTININGAANCSPSSFLYMIVKDKLILIRRLDRNPASFLNPISYEKPSKIKHKLPANKFNSNLPSTSLVL